MAFTGSLWGRRVSLTGLTPVATLNGFVAVVTLDNIPVESIDTGANSALNGGGDLRFSTDNAGVNQLPLEVISFVTSATPGNRSCQLWVRFSTYSSASREVYMFYNRAGQTQPPVTDTFGRNAVWQDFELIIHQGTVTDSTGNHTPSLNGSPVLSGMLWGGQGYNLDTETKFVQIPHANSLNIERNYSLDIWLDPNSTVASQAYVDKVDSGNSTGFRFLAGGSNRVRTRHPNLSTGNLTSNDSNTGQKRLSSDFDGTTRRNIVNAVSVGSDTPTGTVTNNTEDLYIGRTLANNTDYFRAVLGDMWLSKSSRNLNVKSVEYSNQSSPATFWTTGTPEDTGGGGEFQSAWAKNANKLLSWYN